jgi:hypothetical protein
MRFISTGAQIKDEEIRFAGDIMAAIVARGKKKLPTSTRA